MSYKNSFKLLTTNFDLVWKQLVYMLITFVFTASLAYAVALPTLNILKAEGVLAEISNIFESIYTSPKDVAEVLSTTTTHFLDVISQNFNKIWASVLGFVFVVLFIFKFIINISFYNLSDLMHLKMTSFVSMGYTRNLISHLADSVKYAFAKCILDIPFFALKILTITTYFRLANTLFGIIFGLFLVSILLILIYSIEHTLFIGLAPKMNETQIKSNPFKAFFSGNKVILKRFLRNFSNTILIILTVFFVNLFLGIFTIGAGLLITIPATLVILSIFNLACYFASCGEKYYITESVIAIPINDEHQKLN